MPHNLDTGNILFILFVVIIIIWIRIAYISNNTSYDIIGETFVDKIDDDNTDLLEIRLEDKLLGPMRYISVYNFNKIVETIRSIVYRDLYVYSKKCATMNGDDGPETSQMTLFCHNSINDIHEEIVSHIAEYVIDHIKSDYGVNLNPYQVTGDFMTQLNLLEDVINPLMYSNLYTVHGIQYFNEYMLEQKVYYNLKIRDVLYGTLLRRGIDVSPDIDTSHEIDDHI